MRGTRIEQRPMTIQPPSPGPAQVRAVEDLNASVASRAGVRAHPAHQTGQLDLAAAHAVDVAITRGLALLTAEPDPLRAINPDVEIEELPAP